MTGHTGQARRHPKEYASVAQSPLEDPISSPRRNGDFPTFAGMTGLISASYNQVSGEYKVSAHLSGTNP
jgi:hypothetical protein